MLSRKRIAFVIAITAAISTSTISPSTLSGKNRTLAAPLTGNVLPGGANEQDKPTTTEAATPKGKNDRTLRVSRFQGIPVAVTKVRNLQSETWYKDLEIEVKNISDKPIYCISAYLTFPDDYSARSKVAALPLLFGLPKYLDIRVVGNPLDPHLKPGATYILKIREWLWDILRQREKRFPERLRSFVMGFNVFSFGDKTGFTPQSGWADYRGKRPKVLHHRELSLPPSDLK